LIIRYPSLRHLVTLAASGTGLNALGIRTGSIAGGEWAFCISETNILRAAIAIILPMKVEM